MMLQNLVNVNGDVYMSEFQKEIIIKLVYTFAQKANIVNQGEIDDMISKLCSMNVNDSIDVILVSLSDLLARKLITEEDIFLNVEVIIKLNPEKYTCANDLLKRLNWIKGMNMEHPTLSLTENHQLATEAFNQFNKLIQGNFDCYYTGGIMGYFSLNHKLERYHGDLDLFINEQQLMALKELVDSSPDFEFVSNMSQKEIHGHEYKIVYKKTSMSIGLFLFERQLDNSITAKEYYFENESDNRQLFVDEHYYSKPYTNMSFSDTVRYYDGTPYKMMSLESIYNAKKNSRPKDRYDAEIIKNNVDMLVDYKIDVEKKNNFHIKHKMISQSVIHTVEKSIAEQKVSDNVELYGTRKIC